MLPVKPLGHHVLIEIIPVQFKSTGGIILSTKDEVERENKGRQIGKVLSIGPTAYRGFEGCNSPEDWGVKEGDTVELSGRYDGKHSAAVEYNEEYKTLRYVNDSDIIGVFTEEMTKQLVSKGE